MALLWNIFEPQAIRTHSRYTESKTLGKGPEICVFTRPSGDFDVFYTFSTTNLASPLNCSLGREQPPNMKAIYF